MKKNIAYCLLAMCLLGMTGCNKKDSPTVDVTEFKENTTVLNTDGSMQSAVVESFDKDYYKEDELKSFIEENIQKYTKKSGNDTVTLDKLEVDSSVATAQFSYKTAADYATFNAVESEMLTKEQALSDERIGQTVYSVSKGETVDLKTALDEKDYKIFVINLPGENIMTEGKIAYFTNATLSGDKTIKTGEEGITVVIYE